MTTSDKYMARAETASVNDGLAQLNAMLAIAAAIREQNELLVEQNDLMRGHYSGVGVDIE